MTERPIWTTSYRPGGWIRLVSDLPDNARVYMQLKYPHGPRGEVRRCIMTSEARISARSWRQIDFDHVETQAMLTWCDEILRRPAEVEPVPDALEAYFQSTEDEFGRVRGSHYGGHMCGPFEKSGEYVQTRWLDAPERPIPDEFYEELAAVYTGLVANGVSPAPAIAAQTGVSARTVHGWVSQARRRGHLPPARRGTAG